MLNHGIEKEFTYKGYKCVIILQKAGHRCGYVGIPQTHCLYGKTEHNKAIASISCHGGITYTGSSKKSNYPIKSSLWWIGFDCMHFFDGKDFETAKKLYGNDFEALQEVERYEKIFADFRYYKAKSLDFCISECKDIVDQIESVKEKL